MKKLKAILPYIFLFSIFLIWTLLILPTDSDEMWNYGFANNIATFSLPYKDFNMVITPLYPTLMSIPLLLIKSNILVFHITHVLFLLVTVFLLFKLFSDKAWLIIILFFPFCKLLPNYNWFLLLLYVLLIYLETKEDKDFLIGIVLGLFVLTKQSVGLCMFLPTLLYLRKKEKFKKRTIGFLLPLSIFFVYLLTTGTLQSFIDLCVLGLFDFAESNGKISMFIIPSFMLIIATLYFIKKNPQDIKNYYPLTFYSILIPLCSSYHFQFCLIAFVMLVLLNKKVDFKFPYKLFSICVIIGFTLVSMNLLITEKFVYPNDINHFEYRRLTNADISFTHEINKFIKNNKDKKIIFLNSNAYYFRIVNDMKIGYLDLINTGNFGYNGSNKLLTEIKKNQDAIFIVTRENPDIDYQTDLKIRKYVITHGKKIKELNIYDVYIMKE